MSKIEMSRLRRLTESAILIALTFVLHWVSQVIPGMPQGGSVTLASLVPLLVISYRHGVKWGVFSATVFGILRTMLSNNFAWVPATFWHFAGVALLDYIVAFGVIGLADLFRKPFRNDKYLGYAVSTIVVMFLRFVSHFVSGVLIWGSLAIEWGLRPAEQAAWIYSAIYNGSYMLPEASIATVVILLMSKYVKFEKIK